MSRARSKRPGRPHVFAHDERLPVESSAIVCMIYHCRVRAAPTWLMHAYARHSETDIPLAESMQEKKRKPPGAPPREPVEEPPRPDPRKPDPVPVDDPRPPKPKRHAGRSVARRTATVTYLRRFRSRGRATMLSAVLILCGLAFTLGETARADGNSLLISCRAAADVYESGGDARSAGSYENTVTTALQCANYVRGSFETYALFSQEARNATNARSPICFPGDVTVGQAVRVVLAYLEANPAQLTLDDVALVHLAFASAFPCDRGPDAKLLHPETTDGSNAG